MIRADKYGGIRRVALYTYIPSKSRVSRKDAEGKFSIDEDMLLELK